MAILSAQARESGSILNSIQQYVQYRYSLPTTFQNIKSYVGQGLAKTCTDIIVETTVWSREYGPGVGKGEGDWLGSAEVFRLVANGYMAQDLRSLKS